MSVVQTRDGVIGISPLERPDVGLITAVHEAGALGVLDVGRDTAAARRVLAQVSAVRIPEGVDLELPPNITTVIVGEPGMVARYLPRRVLAQVTSVDEARIAIDAGASGVIAKGMEAGGRIGDETTFVLVQRLVALGAPVWAQGGIGGHTAAACIAGGGAGDVPWGGGILGLVPQEIREAQLEVIKEILPPIALIAGGRPSQAAPREAQGTATYLHVPSPGLLDLFLKDGARRFVFEGSECGGHTGPRTSFVLWQQQIARILEDEHAGECDVLFAGGIHDARSAAMIATMAAPLAARGARVGVVMGTAI